MGIKTDYLKDCSTLETITVQEIVNLKRNSLSSASLEQGVNDLKKEIDDRFKIIKKEQSDLFDTFKSGVNNELGSLHDEFISAKDEYDKKFNDFKKFINDELNKLSKKLDEIYNKVVQFNFFNTLNILRNKNNDIYKIEYTNGFYMEIDYVNLTYSDSYENYFPSKITYYDDSDEILAIDKIDIKDNSIIGTSNKEL